MSPRPPMERAEPWPRPELMLLRADVAGVPVPLTSLVGRESELAKARTLLDRPNVRLLTLTGPGGIGKTSVALHLAADLAGNFRDGVCFVALEAVRDPALVAAAIAQAVNVQPRPGDDVRESLVAALHSADMLLVVDNFEHVVSAAMVLTDLLARCPRLTILVTSQVLLRVSGEHTLAIPPLALPDLQSSPSSDDLFRSAAVRLFEQRARAVDGSFDLTETHAQWVAEICRRLDGIPLAIELVAPRVRHLALPDLLSRLDQRLPLLTGGARDQPGRLQTMRNAIAWSYDLLADRERRVFRRLAVFTGGFTLAAAEWVVRAGSEEGDPERQPGVFDDVGTLIDASLVHIEHAPDGSVRYRMLETIREFALESLETSGEGDEARRAHASHFLAFAERHEYAVLLEDVDQGLIPLEADYANLRSALGWLDQAGEHGALLRLVTSMSLFWSDHGYYREGHAWLSRALATPGPVASDRARALVAIGMIEIFLGMHQEAETNLTTGLAECQDHDKAFDAGLALIGLGCLATIQGDLERSASFLESCLVATRRVADERLAWILEGWALINLAVVARTQGDLELADRQLAGALDCMRGADYAVGVILALGDQGDLARDQRDPARALELYREALGLGWGIRGRRITADVVEAVAVVAVTVGQEARGVRLLGASEALRERVGLRFRVVKNQLALDQALTDAQAVLGQNAFATAWAAGRLLGAEQVIELASEPFPIIPPPPERPSASGTLTRRETEIARLVAAGETDAAIAASLFLSVRTVENHVAHILAKLGIHTRADVARVADLHPEPLPPA